VSVQKTLSGTTVGVESVIHINQNLRRDRADAQVCGFTLEDIDIVVPSGHRIGRVSQESFEEFNALRERACADIVITTRLENGMSAVLAIKRAKTEPFGGCWWMQGGGYGSYELIGDFLLKRAEQECGVRPALEGFMGVFRTCAEDIVCSTTNLCFVGFAEFDHIRRARIDREHVAWRLLTLADLDTLPSEETHWYPSFTFRRALETMPPPA